MESWHGLNYYTENTTKWVQLMNLSTAEWGLGFLPATLVAIPGHLNDSYDFPSDSIVIENASKTKAGVAHIEALIFGLASTIVGLWALYWLYVNHSEMFSPRSSQNSEPSDAASQGTSVTELTTFDDGFVQAKDFLRNLKYFYYDSDKSELEVGEKDISIEGISTDDIENAGALFRKMYGLDLKLWSMENSRERTAAGRNKIMHESDAILAEVTQQVHVWQADMSNPTTTPATEDEKREMYEIVETLRSIGQERYPNKQPVYIGTESRRRAR